MLMLVCLQLVAANIATGSADLQLAVAIAAACFSVYLAWKGNALIARKWFACGYDFVQPDSAEASYAREQWGVDTPLAEGPQANSFG